jgi:hypothetical protein
LWHGGSESRNRIREFRKALRPTERTSGSTASLRQKDVSIVPAATPERELISDAQGDEDERLGRRRRAFAPIYRGIRFRAGKEYLWI